MKKIVVIALAVVMMLSTMLFTSCGNQNKNIAVKDIELTAESYAFVIKKGNAEMKKAADELLAELKASGELDNIINAFFDGNATFKYQNPASKEGCLVVATNAYFPPFEFYEGDKLTGVDMQIASLLAEKLGKKLYVLDEAFSSIFTSVENGEADIGMAGITVNETRLKTYDFSTEYYTSAQVITVLENDTTFDNCKTAEDVEKILAAKDKNYVIGTQKGTTGYMYSAGDEGFGYDGFKNLTVKDYANGALIAKDLQNGTVNAMILDKQPSLMIAKSLNK